MKKFLFVLPALLFCLTLNGLSQDSTSFNIQNPLQTTPQQYEILSVEVTGLTTTREDFVINTSGLEVGTTVTIPGSDIGDAINRLNRTGLFSNIEIIDKGRTSTGINLEIRVQEQPKLQNFEIRGVKKSQRNDLRERITLMPGFAVTEAATGQAVNTIQRYYKENGYWFTNVDVSTSKTDTVRNRLTVYFDVDPGEKLEIKDISFEGNESFSDRTLRKQLDAIKEDVWWRFFSKKLYKEEEFETAKENLKSFYGENGFLDFRVTGDSVYTFPYTQRRLFFLTNDATGIKVNIKVQEGPQYKVREINWDGNTVYTDEQLTEALGFEEGEVFNLKKFNENTESPQNPNSISSLYQNVGYLFFQYQEELNVVNQDSIDITMNIYEDQVATVEAVEFSGNTKTHDDVVRRSLRTVPGQKYSRQNVIRTIRELGQLGYFRPEAITPNLQPDREDYTVDISYELDESQSTDNFEFSGGFGGRGIGIILSARLNFNNFSLGRAVRGEGWNPIPSGDGQKLSLGVQVTGSGYQSYNLGFQEPWLSGKPISFGTNLSYDLIKFRNSNARNELFSSSVSLGRRLKWPDDYFSQRTILSYQLYDVVGGASFLAEGTSSILSIKEVIERNSTDNPISPTTGSKFQISGEIAPPLPGFSQFYKIKTMYQNHTSLVGKLVLTNGIEYGYLGYLGTSQRSNFQRFILGGTQLQQRQSFLDDNIDLRGFPGGNTGSISPLRDGEQVGGRLYSKYTMELRYPAISEEQVQVIPYTFFDAGNAYLDFQDFAPFEVKRSVGFGARVFLPILGLVDLSYGYRLDGIPGTNIRAGEWEFLFNIGAPF
ncbi:MAG TPA: outer membrane protein assembly factor BamA [Halalkalibaculum sp.]|nr:outer membrane protein assembly factor BamA [Halalkalibaculum sp.]